MESGGVECSVASRIALTFSSSSLRGEGPGFAFLVRPKDTDSMRWTTVIILGVMLFSGTASAEVRDIYQIPIERFPLTLNPTEALVKIDTMGFKRLADLVFFVRPNTPESELEEVRAQIELNMDFFRLLYRQPVQVLKLISHDIAKVRFEGMTVYMWVEDLEAQYNVVDHKDLDD